MTTINLLPWREQKREQEKKEFIAFLLAGVMTALLIVGCMDYYAISLSDAQSDRNARLKTEIATFDKQLKEIKNLKALRQALIARMIMVQNLQASRTLTVHLLDEMIRILPMGVYLYQVDRVGDKVTVLGYADSNTEISQLMRNIEGSYWITDPKLTEIKKTDEVILSEDNAFKLSFVLKSKSTLGTAHE